MNRLIRFFSVFLFLVVVALPAFAQANTEATKFAEDFFKIYPTKDFEKMPTIWSEKSPDREKFLKQLRFSLTDTENISFKDFAVKSSTLENDKLILQISLTMDATDAQTKRPKWNFGKWNRTLRLVKENGAWKVWQCKFAEEEFAEKLANSKDATEQDALLAEKPELINRFLRRAIIDLNRALRARNELGKVVFLAEMMERLAAKTADETWLARAFFSKGALFYYLGEQGKADAFYLKSEKLSLKLNDEEGLVLVWFSVGLLRLIQTELEQGDSYYRKSAELAEKIGDVQTLLRVRNNQGIGFFGEAQRDIWTNPLNFDRVKLPEKPLREALAYFRQIRDIYDALGDERGRTVAIANIGEAYRFLREYDNALKNYDEAIALAEKNQVNSLRDGILSSICLTYIGQNRLAEAAELIEKVTASANPNNLSSEFFQDELLAGSIFHRLGQNEKAEKYFLGVIEKYEKQRKSIANTITRQRFLHPRAAPYYEMANLRAEQNRPEEALQFAEMIKARVLFDIVRSGAKFSEKSLTEEEKLQSEKLKTDIENLNRQFIEEQLKSKPDEAKIKKLNENLAQARVDYEKFESYLFSIHPEMNLQRGEIPLVQLSEIESLVPDDKTAILEYAVTDEKVLVFVLTKFNPPATAGGSDKTKLNPSATAGGSDKTKAHPPVGAGGSDQNGKLELEVYQLPITRRELVSKVRNLWKQIAEQNFGYKESASELYKLLIQPLKQQLKNRNNLIIVPDGVLWELPFQALISPDNKYLIEDFAVSYTPSLSVLREMSKTKNDNSPANLLAFGNPFLNQEIITLAAKRNRNLKLEPLPEAEKEVLKIASFYGAKQSRLFIGKTASEQVFKSLAGKFNILHFATHGIANDENPMYSFLVFSQANETKEDGILEAWEIMQMNLNADLAVLSACQTARGQVGGGEGMIGLSWAFFVAGVPTTIVSQWNVESKSTADLMVEFYRQLRQNPSKATALQTATISLLKNKRTNHPYFWAGFVLIGKS